jgi:selenocysteine lyase/cysteine desulfurase
MKTQLPPTANTPGATHIDVAEVRALFPGLRDKIYMNTATMNVGCTPAREAYERAVDGWSAGRFDWLDAERAGDDARSLFAEIVGASAEDVALIPAVSAAAGTVAANMPAAKRGENVVVAEREFSSNFFPWLLLRERGYDVRMVPVTGDTIPADSYAAVADAGTRLIAVSAVQSATGYRADLGGLSKVAARSGAWFFVDACQAAGAVDVDVVRDNVDFLAAASHKFLLGSRGMGYLYVRRALIEHIHPVLPGWKAARKPFESFYGPTMELSPTASKLDTSLAWFAALADRAALGLFRRFGIHAVLERNARLSARLHDALIARLPDFRPFAEQHRSPIVSVPVKDTDATMARLRTANVVASVRAGRVRLSLHLYNLDEEIETVVGLLSA